MIPSGCFLAIHYTNCLRHLDIQFYIQATLKCKKHLRPLTHLILFLGNPRSSGTPPFFPPGPKKHTNKDLETKQKEETDIRAAASWRGPAGRSPGPGAPAPRASPAGSSPRPEAWGPRRPWRRRGEARREGGVEGKIC